MIALVLQSFGSENEYKRAIFSIWSYYVHVKTPPQGGVIVFTDNPEYFKSFLNGLQVRYIQLTPQKIAAMRGDIDFLHRMKIALIEESFKITQGDLLYIDSDTFFIADISKSIEELSSAVSFMHNREYAFSSLQQMRLPAATPFHAFLKLIREQDFQLPDNHATLKIEETSFSWNAGVMLLHRSHSRFLSDIYAMTEQFYVPTRNHASEQYAFSIILANNTNLKSVENYVYHYWYRIEKQVTDAFLATKITEAWAETSESRKLNDVTTWIETLIGRLEKDVLVLRDKAIQSFNEYKYRDGYLYATKALVTNPFDVKFIKDVLYHTRKLILKGSNL